MSNNRFFTFLVGIALLVITALTIREVLATGSVVAEINATNRSYATNPELIVVDHDAAARNANREATLLSANPELSAARRYSVENATALYSTNPELSVVQRYFDKIGASILLSANPELSVARRYTEIHNGR